MVAMGLWGLCLPPDKPLTVRFPEAVLIANAALTDQLQDTEGRTSVRIAVSTEKKYESSLVLCSLTPGKVDQCLVNITLNSEVTYTFHSIGPNTVYLAGNFVDELATIRVLRDTLTRVPLEAQKTPCDGDPADSEAGPATVDPADPSAIGNVKKRRRTSGGEASTAGDARKQRTKGKEVEYSKPEGVQWIDFGKPGQGDRIVKRGDKIMLKYRMVVGNDVMVANNSGLSLSLTVGDTTACIPQAVHLALIGMKLGAQRIVKVTSEAAQKDPGLGHFLKPAQAYRIDIFVLGFNATPPKASTA